MRGFFAALGLVLAGSATMVDDACRPAPDRPCCAANETPLYFNGQFIECVRDEPGAEHSGHDNASPS